MPVILQCNYTIILASKYIMSEFNYVDSLTQGFRYAYWGRTFSGARE